MKHYVLKKPKNRGGSIERKKTKKMMKKPFDIDLDISDPFIKEFIDRKGIKLKSYNELIHDKKERIRLYNENLKTLEDSELRRWLQKSGKEHLIDFSDHKRGILKKCFDTLDDDQSGQIGVSEMEEPLISIGIAENRKQVKQILDTVDQDGSGCIEFEEFLQIIKQANQGDNQQCSIKQFFNDLTQGKLADGQIPSQLSFKMILSMVRRRNMMYLTSENAEERNIGLKVVKAYDKYVTNKRIREEESMIKNEQNREGM